MTQSLIRQFNKARCASTPLIAIQTPDIQATINAIAADKDNSKFPILQWDCVRGLAAVNEPHGRTAYSRMVENKNAAKALCNPVEMLDRLNKPSKQPDLRDPQGQRTTPVADALPEGGIIFMSNLHRYFIPETIQALWNLRDIFKVDSRTLVILCPAITLPPEISGDVLVLNEPLPNEAQLASIVNETYDAVEIKRPEPPLLNKAVDALCGLAAFSAEQVCAMSVTEDGLDLPQLWERKRQQIEQTPGLSVWRGQQKFTDIGGCGNIKQFLTAVKNGENRPRAVVFQDELEKQVAGSGGDTSGTTQELLQMQLTYMQDHDSTGVMFIGHPGVAKSDIAKAFGNEAGIPTIQLDLGSAKDSYVGNTNKNMAMILKVIEATSQDRAIWISTCNNIKNLPPELKRRYSYGTFFFDLPTQAERALIWNIYLSKFKLDQKSRRPNDLGWTGAEIKNCCLLARNLSLTLEEATNYIAPISVTDPERIATLRSEADNRYISASTAGFYKKPEGAEEPPETDVIGVAVFAQQKPKRKINTEPNKGGKGDKGSGSVN